MINPIEPRCNKKNTHEADKVHSYIIHFISENTVSEQNVLLHNYNMNLREDFLALKYLYEWVGENAKVVLVADNNIQELYYAGKKKPTCGGTYLRSG